MMTARSNDPHEPTMTTTLRTSHAPADDLRQASPRDGMQVLRTPDARFADLPDYPFAPHYCSVCQGLRLHYVDEGPRDAPVVLMLHGEPSWSYLYRHMIPLVVQAGYRVVAPDLIGFGKSDKPARQSDYGFSIQVGWIREWIESLDLRDITLVCQDWGSLIGLRLAAENEERFAGVVLSNGGLPTGEEPMTWVWRVWEKFARLSPWFPIDRILKFGTKRRLSAGEMAAYAAPFPDDSYKAGARVYPSLVPVRFDDPEAAADRRARVVFSRWDKPFLTCFSDGDPITRGFDAVWAHVPGTRGQPHTTLHGGHFIQEDDPQTFARVVIQQVASNPLLQRR
jgi:haloalkane dehalogenase